MVVILNDLMIIDSYNVDIERMRVKPALALFDIFLKNKDNNQQ